MVLLDKLILINLFLQIFLKGMTDAIAHRGPDGEGHWIEENIGLGHRRLAIIDTVQDFTSTTILSCRFLFTYNGIQFSGITN